jgi:hypothetical protein
VAQGESSEFKPQFHIHTHTQKKAEIRRIKVQRQPGQIVLNPVSKIPNTKQDWWTGLSGTATYLASMRL